MGRIEIHRIFEIQGIMAMQGKIEIHVLRKDQVTYDHGIVFRWSKIFSETFFKWHLNIQWNLLQRAPQYSVKPSSKGTSIFSETFFKGHLNIQWNLLQRAPQYSVKPSSKGTSIFLWNCPYMMRLPWSQSQWSQVQHPTSRLQHQIIRTTERAQLSCDDWVSHDQN